MLQAVRMLTELARPSEDRERSNARSMDGASSSTDIESDLRNISVQFREIHKNGWLRRTDKTDKEICKFWVAFCVHDDMEPRLEGYVDQKQATTHSPMWSHSLRNVLHLSPTLCATQRNDYEFCVNFNDDRVLRLAAPTYQAMYDWVQAVTRKLTDMKILRPKENFYSKGPERIVTRDPTSPLPPPPSIIGTSNTQRPVALSPSSASAANTSPFTRETTSGTTPSVFTFDDASVEEHRLRPGTTHTPAQRTPPPIPSPRIPPPPTPSPSIATATATTTTITTTSNDDVGNSSYESVFLASSHPSNEDATPTAVNLNLTRNDESSDRYAALMEYRSLGNTETENPSEQTREVRGITPNIRRQLTLREQQVMHLRREMSHPAGVRLQLGRRDCKDGIAFVDTFGAVWVAGWKQREHPLLHNFLHVGDLVLSVAGVPPAGATAVKNILKNCTTPRVEMIVKRLPHARALTLTRRSESDDFGLEVNANEVSRVGGVALSQGLPSYVPAADPAAPLGTTVTWSLTEVNGRPLNIFEGGAQERLGAVGRDISVVLQPTDLVSSLRKRLRAIRNYKNFVVQ
ncbi:uncharacterized protein LOC122498774 [Leptopilina heterotoma]|uniref:uncharacterized protein LOC122498774 n=1 Tax=Leptopilina heterotoma TaxID=63436 RepID=UPI001CAA0EC8|nr:uncharacterized protein LOC122498774 [Leptopilina heterotoma]